MGTPDVPNPSIPPPYFLPPGVAPPDAGALPLSGLTVLLVEDSRFASDALRLMCHRSGARLRRAATMAQARAHLQVYHPDVVIIDLGLPDGRGDMLIRELVLARQGSVVLGLSGDPGGQCLALAAGAVGFLEKPIAGLGAFQRAVLRHVPGRFAPTVAQDGKSVPGDRLALHDDLAHADDLMSLSPDEPARRYLAGFVAGVARSAGDVDLATAARAAALAEDALPQLRQIVRQRLAAQICL